MSGDAPPSEMPEADRPVAFIEPDEPFARRARAALRDGRLGDAEELIHSMADRAGDSQGRPTRGSDATVEPGGTVRRSQAVLAWRLVLEGELRFAKGDLGPAESRFMQAAVVALACGTGFQQVGRASPAVPPSDENVGRSPTYQALPSPNLRLAAYALDRAGCVYRRLDQPGDAVIVHEQAYSLRQQAGSFEELAQSASNLGLDADMRPRFDEARKWHGIAVENARRCPSALVENGSHTPVENLCHTARHYRQTPGRRAKPALPAENRYDTHGDRLRALVWGRLSDSLTQAGAYDEAIEAARQARKFAHAHAAGTLEAFRTDVKLCRALLRQGESLIDRDDPRAADVLADARTRLRNTLNELASFGPEADGDAHWCSEQLDHVKRLSAIAP